jgi:hypothetical protein
VSATTNTTISVTDLPAALQVNVTADPPVILAPGGPIAYSVRVANISEVDMITLQRLEDSILGDLAAHGCPLPTAPIIAGSFYECDFTDTVSGTAGETVARTVTAVGVSDDLNQQQVQHSADNGVLISELPPQSVFLATVADDVVEPNNSCRSSYPLQLNRQYHFLAEDVQDGYSFRLQSSQNIKVELTNFVPREGQLLVWKGECDSLMLIGQNPDTSLVKILDLGTQPPGPYIIQIINDAPPNTVDLYGLIVLATDAP